MKVLVTGGTGYVGSILVPYLIDQGYDVVVIDRLFFGNTLKEYEGKNLKVIKDDIRWFDPYYLKNIDYVIDLASLSNDPSGELNKELTYSINYKGRVRVAKLSKKYGVKKYILASSASVYGFQKDIVNESSDTNPLTTYSKSALLAEQEIKSLADKDFNIIVFRKSTIYGYSPRMRLDLVINAMAFYLLKNGILNIMRDGKQWRPFVHIKDVANAYLLALEKDIDKEHDIFNVGSNEQNYQIFPLAEEIASGLGMELKYEWYGDPDKRSYKVDFSKIKEILGFKAKYTPKDAAKEIKEKYDNGELEDSIKTKTVLWYKYLIEAHNVLKEIEINGKLF